jgi:peptidyl-prolyl cis-trans isomerase C
MHVSKLLLVSAVLGVLSLACSSSDPQQPDPEQMRQYASDLLNRDLYEQAVEQYSQYLSRYDISEREQANIHYIIANTYFDRIKDYERALSIYLKIKHFYPESPLMDEVNKRIVACLERLERSTDAQQALQETVQADAPRQQQKRPGAVVARIGDRDITLGDLEYELDQLPPSVQAQFSGVEKKAEFLREYVATELLYDTAKRAGLDDDPEVIEGAFQSKKMLMVRKLIQDRVAGTVEIDDKEIELYYKAHKERYAETNEEGEITRQPSLSEVQEQVARDLYEERYTEAYQKLVRQMMQAENVEFYKNRIQ